MSEESEPLARSTLARQMFSFTIYEFTNSDQTQGEEERFVVGWQGQRYEPREVTLAWRSVDIGVIVSSGRLDAEWPIDMREMAMLAVLSGGALKVPGMMKKDVFASAARGAARREDAAWRHMTITGAHAQPECAEYRVLNSSLELGYAVWKTEYVFLGAKGVSLDRVLLQEAAQESLKHPMLSAPL